MKNMFEADIEKIKNKSYSLDLTNIVLTNKKSAFEGVGNVSQDEEGNLILKFYCNKKGSITGLTWKTSAYKSEVGKLIAHSEYYSLNATDLSGRVWSSKRILPSTSMGIDGTTVVTAKIYRMKGVSPISDVFSKISGTIIYPFEGKFPFNSARKIEETMGAELLSRSSAYDQAVYDTIDSRSRISKNDSFLEVFYSSKSDNLPKYYLKRISESLQFILAKKMHWIFIRKYKSGNEYIYLRSFYETPRKSIFHPPIAYMDHDIDGNCTKLFESYLNNIASNIDALAHPYFSSNYSLIQAGEGSVETLGLMLGVRVEGFIKDFFKELKVKERITKEQQDSLMKHFKAGTFDESIENRINTFLGSLRKLSANDLLYELVSRGLIEEDWLKAWKKLRNLEAHAEKENDFDLAKYIELIDKVTMLYYRLVFLKIGYQGAYTDYSPGWKTILFEKKYEQG